MDPAASSSDDSGMSRYSLSGLSFIAAQPSGRRKVTHIYKCTECSYETVHSSTMKTHKKTHSAERPFKCEICSKSFKLKHHLKHHLMTHKLPNIFKCNMCQYRGTSSLSLLLHKQKKHGESSIPQINMHRVLNNVVREPRASVSYTPTFPTWTSIPSTSGSHPDGVPPTLTEAGFRIANEASNQPVRSRSLSEADGLPTITNVCTSEASPRLPHNLNFGFRFDLPRLDDIDAGMNPVKTESADFVNLVDDESVGSDRAGDGPFPPVSEAAGSSVLNSPSFNGSVSSSSLVPITSPNLPRTDTSRPDIVPSLTASAATMPVTDSWKCEPCGITFSDNIMYGLHTACHSVQQPYKCNICGRVCRDKYDFTFHITMGRHEL